MKVMIDIPKREYDKICKTMLHTSSGNPNFYFESKIANGIPLEQIRAEIDDLDRHYDNDYFSGNRDAMFKCNEVLQILDKYKGDKE